MFIRDRSSTAQIAKQLGAPVVLVIDCKAMGESAAAIAMGFREYDKDVDFKGVILNRLGSDNHERMVREGMEKIGVPVIGAIRRDDRMHSPERHLGLTPVTEVDPTEAVSYTHLTRIIHINLIIDTVKPESPAVCNDSGYFLFRFFAFYEEHIVAFYICVK